MHKWTLLLLALSINNVSFGLQIKSAINNETISAKISATDVTRIVVQGDRIQSVKGIKGAYTRDNDNNSGEIYIQPSSFYQNRAFTLLINTEMGRHYTLLLNPMSVPSDTLMLVPKGVGQVQAARFENSSPYDLTITHLINAMKSGALPDGYIAKGVKSKKTYLYGNIASLKLKTVYEGLNLRGEIWEITNKQDYAITLNERNFYRKGTRAISLDTINILPHGNINLYRVMSNAR